MEIASGRSRYVWNYKRSLANVDYDVQRYLNGETRIDLYSYSITSAFFPFACACYSIQPNPTQPYADPLVEDTAPKMQPAPESLACVDYNDVKGNETEQQDPPKSQPTTPKIVAGIIDCKDVNGNETKQDPPQLSHPTPETTLACIDCGAMKGKEGFYKSQW